MGRVYVAETSAGVKLLTTENYRVVLMFAYDYIREAYMCAATEATEADMEVESVAQAWKMKVDSIVPYGYTAEYNDGYISMRIFSFDY
jgi:hypothetical protein